MAASSAASCRCGYRRRGNCWAGNGAASLEELRTQIGRYRKAPIQRGEDPEIGCLFLRDPHFFPVTASAAAPPGFAGNIVQGKGYDLAERSVAPYFGELVELLLGVSLELDLSQPSSARAGIWRSSACAVSAGPTGVQGGRPRCLSPAVRGHRHAHSPWFSRQRTSARLLRAASTGSMKSCCSGRTSTPSSTAVTSSVDPEYRLRVSPPLREEFGNGEQFYAKAGQVIELPARRADRPHREFLEWHLDEVFKAS